MSAPRALEEAAHHYNLGIELERDRKYEEAKREFRLACEMDPQFAYPYKSLGDLHRREGRFQEAAESLGKALEIDPEWRDAAAAMAETLYELGRLDEAIRWQMTVARRDPENPGHFALLGRMFVTAGRFQDAIDLLTGALKKFPGRADLEYGMGLAYARWGQKNLDRSIEIWESAFRSDPGVPQLARNLGISYYAQGRLPEAEAAFKKALDIDKTDAVALRFLDLARRLQS